MIKTDKLRNALLDALEPPPDLNIWQWADKYRILSSEASAEPGPWRTDRFPFMREVMEELSPQSDREEIVLMSGAQVAKTENCLNLMGFSIDYDPCPMLYVQKTEIAVERFSKQRFSKSLENSPSIKDKISNVKSRDGSNTISLKNFPGGMIIMGGASSASSLRSMPIKKLLLDEEDSYDIDIQEEGDPIQLAIRRTANFPGRKIFHISTPGVTETSRIEPLFEEGDQRYYHVPCPFCGFYQIIKWKNLKYNVTDMGSSFRVDDVKLQCEECSELIEERFKTEMLAAGKWIAENPGVDIASFHLNSFYSPLGFYSWKDAVKLWMKYKRSRAQEQLKVFVNTVLGETFSATGKTVDHSQLASHKMVYQADVPEGVKVLVAGADVQDDRIEVEVLGVGDDLETWSISYKKFIGDTEEKAVWNQLDEFLSKPFKHVDGYSMYVLGAGIDSGHKAKIVYDFCRKREFKRFVPIKGVGGWGHGIIDRSKYRNKSGVFLLKIFVDEMKTKVYSQLKLDSHGPGYCHFPDKDEYNDDYFMMLSSERLQRKRNGGQWKLSWHVLRNRRNEALDCRNYALGFLYMMFPDIEAINRIETPVIAKPSQATGKARRRKVVSRGIQ